MTSFVGGRVGDRTRDLVPRLHCCCRTIRARGGGQVVDAAVLVFAVKARQVEDVLCVTIHFVGGDMVGEDRVGGKEK